MESGAATSRSGLGLNLSANSRATTSEGLGPEKRQNFRGRTRNFRTQTRLLATTSLRGRVSRFTRTGAIFRAAGAISSFEENSSAKGLRMRNEGKGNSARGGASKGAIL